MAIQKYRGGSMINDAVPQSFSTILDRFFSDSMSNRNMMANFSPRVDTCETENGFEIEMALPGMKEDDIKIDFHDSRLTISGERKFTDEKKEKKYHIIENQYGSFSRAFYLPPNTNPETIEAEFIDGVLRILVPKDDKRIQKHQIRVKGKSTADAGNGNPAKNNGAKSQQAKTGQNQP